MAKKRKDILLRNEVFGWIALGTAVLLVVPLVAMQFTDEVNWTLTDFVVMGALVFGMSSLFVLVARRTPRKNRLFVALAFAAAFLYLWAELAVGVFFD